MQGSHVIPAFNLLWYSGPPSLSHGVFCISVCIFMFSLKVYSLCVKGEQAGLCCVFGLGFNVCSLDCMCRVLEREGSGLYSVKCDTAQLALPRSWEKKRGKK